MEGISKEAQMYIAASATFPGFRFSPTDEEIISFYLRNKLEGSEKSVEVVPQIELWRNEPWDLPAKSIIQSESEWFFFSPRGRRYPNGSCSKRATELGYWKGTGKVRDVKSNSMVIGTKRTLVYHMGRAPKGERTEWLIHEYCMNGTSQDSLVMCRLRKSAEFRLNEPMNPASSSQRQSAVAHDSSILDPQRIEQVDSIAELNHKTTAEVMQSSDHERDLDDDDFYADILKDDIINLDDSSVPTRSDFMPLNPNWLEADVNSHQAREDFVTDPYPSPGNADRRILQEKDTQRFNEGAFDALKTSEDEHVGGKFEIDRSDRSPICIMSIGVFSSRKINRLVRIVVFVVSILLAWSRSSLSASWLPIRRSLFEGVFH